jgi:hypothetical protein
VVSFRRSRRSSIRDAAENHAVFIQRGDLEGRGPLDAHNPGAKVRLQGPPVLLAVLDEV